MVISQGATELSLQSVQSYPVTHPAVKVLLVRNRQINNSNEASRLPTKLPTTYTESIGQSAARLAAFLSTLKQEGGPAITDQFLRNPYNLIWLEQMIKMDPKKVALAMTVNNSIQKLAKDQNLDEQFIPALNLGTFVAMEKIKDFGSDVSSSNIAMALRQQEADGDLWGEKALSRHLQEYLTKIQSGLVGAEREKAMIEVVSKDIYARLKQHSEHAKILKQSQGVEVEVLSRLENLPPELRITDRTKLQLERAERLGIVDWLPRGTKLNELKRTDWRLLTILGLNDDIAESKYERFEMTTHPTVGSSAQSTLLYEMVLGGFVTEDILSNTWEKYSLHMSTTFPTAIWNDRSHAQYVNYARTIGGAFASQQRGVYGGYVWDDTVGREIADKSLETNAFTPVAGQSRDSISGKTLIEIRLMDLTEKGQYSAAIHKEYLDFGFRCFWQQQEGVPMANAAEYRAANVWQQFYAEISDIYRQHNVVDEWWGVGWKKVEDPQLQKDLAAAIRKYSGQLRHEVEYELKNPEKTMVADSRPSYVLGNHDIVTVEDQSGHPNETRIIIDQDEFAQLHLQPNSWITLRFGDKTVSARIVSNEGNTKNVNRSIGISQSAKKRLMVPDNLNLSLRFDPMKSELALGPTVGTIANIEDRSLVRPFGEQTRYHRSNILAARAQGMYSYVFDPHDVNVSEGTINALTLARDGNTWINVQVPLPDLIFDRNFGEFPAHIRQALSHIPFVNPREFPAFIADKETLPLKIRENPRFTKYVPETIKFNDRNDLTTMLEKHSVIYLKPTWGMRSYGVVRIERLPDGKFKYNHTRPSGNPEDESFVWASKGQPGYEGYTVDSIDEILTATRDIRSGYKDYIVQQGVQMAKDSHGDMMEMRFLIQRGQNGKLSVIGWKEGQQQYWLPEFAKAFGQRNSEVINQNAQALAQAIALQIQSSYGGHFGQMSVQIAIDDKGNPWFLEANPKPGVTNQFDAYEMPALTDYASRQLSGYMGAIGGFSEASVPIHNIIKTTLSDGTQVEAIEEQNPLVVYQFAQATLGQNIARREQSVYNLKSLQRIQENLAHRTRYITLRDTKGNILGCISLLQPYRQWLHEPKDPSVNFDTKPRWEIGGMLVNPKIRGKGIASKLFEVAMMELKRAGAKEAIVNVTGTFDKSKAGMARDDSVGVERIIRNNYDNRLLGVGWSSYGPTYVVDVPQN